MKQFKTERVNISEVLNYVFYVCDIHLNISAKTKIVYIR